MKVKENYLVVAKAKIAELQTKAKNIQDKCSGWKKCQDGSYEMAMSGYGY